MSSINIENITGIVSCNCSNVINFQEISSQKIPAFPKTAKLQKLPPMPENLVFTGSLMMDLNGKILTSNNNFKLAQGEAEKIAQCKTTFLLYFNYFTFLNKQFT